MSYQSHQHAGQGLSASCAIITLSDTRTIDTDRSGQTLHQLLQAAGHTIGGYHLIPDDPALLEPLLLQLFADESINCIITNGGTGISRRDQTIDIITRHLETQLPGFGELFRMLSFEQIQSGAMLSRALGGIARSKLVFALPGSTKAVELAMIRLILPEIGHLLAELRK
jgi:molybdenum cofactor biosynthesis protein B